MDECVEIARKLGERVGNELGVPGYFYESAALMAERQNLATCRKGHTKGWQNWKRLMERLILAHRCGMIKQSDQEQRR